MSSHNLVSVLRQKSIFTSGVSLVNSQAVGLTSRRITYPQTYKRNHPIKSNIRELRKQKERMYAPDGSFNLKDIQKEYLPFFIPARTKLLFKCLSEQQNNTRYSRKPMPLEVKKNFVEKIQEYMAFKQAERIMIQQEELNYLKAKIPAVDALFFLPDYLFHEAVEFNDEILAEQMQEYNLGQLYLEQMMRVFPKELTQRFRFGPAIEETLIKMMEQGQEKKEETSAPVSYEKSDKGGDDDDDE